MKKILMTTAMVAMSSTAAFAFDTTADDKDAEVLAATGAITALINPITFNRVDTTNGATTTFTPTIAAADLNATVSGSITPTNVVQYQFTKDTTSTFSFTVGTSVPVEASTANIASAVNGVKTMIQDEYYGTTITSSDGLTTETTTGIVGGMIEAMVADVTTLNTYAVDNLITGQGAGWSTFDGYASTITTNLTTLNNTITAVDLALTETTAAPTS